MKLSRFSILAVAALTCTAFAVSCESDDPSKAVAPFWADGDIDGSALNGGNGGKGGKGFGDDGFDLNGDAGLRPGGGFDLNGGNGSDNSDFDLNGPGAFGEDLTQSAYIDGFGARIEGVEFTPLYFPYDQNTISSQEESKVAAVAQYLLGHSEAGVVVEGYCDERGTEEYNRALGERRAVAASDMLVDIYGIEANRVKTVSYGEERPAVSGTGESVWSKNRRDEFIPVYLKNN